MRQLEPKLSGRSRVREVPVSVGLSLLVHAVALGWYVETVPIEDARAPAKPLVSRELAAPEETTFEVALLEDDTVAQIHDQPTRTTSRVAPAVAKMAQVAATTTSEAPVITEPPAKATSEKKSPLAMRSRDSISDEALENMVNRETSVRIANIPGAKEDADIANAQARLHSQGWVQNATPDELAAARMELSAARRAKREVELVAQKDGTYTADKTTFHAKVNQDGTVDIHDKGNWQQQSLFHAELDATDALMRLYGQDPYAAEKRELLDRTREQRYEIGKRYRTAQLAGAATLMSQNLTRLWVTTGDPVKRKDELFALWDECAETGDDEVVEAGAAARRVLMNWVQMKRVEFTSSEIASLNARKKSKAIFAPPQ